MNRLRIDSFVIVTASLSLVLIASAQEPDSAITTAEARVLRDSFAHGSHEEQLATASMMERHPSLGGVAGLWPLALKSRYPDVRGISVGGVAGDVGGSIETLLITHFETKKNQFVRAKLLIALANTEGTGATALLNSVLLGSDSFAASVVCATLAKSGDHALPFLAQARIRCIDPHPIEK